MAAVFLCALSGCGKPPPAAVDLPTPGPQGVAAARAVYPNANLDKGREAYALCVECHVLAGPSGAKGPSLERIFGAPAAARDDFPYSEALRRSGLTWDARRLEHWLFNPREAMPGTSMGFIGVRNDAKRRDLVAYLAAMSAEPLD